MRRAKRAAGVLPVLVVLLLAVSVPAGLADVPGEDCTIRGKRVHDLIRGTPHRDIICARGGDDVILAGAGNDRVFARNGDNRIYGGPGNDQLLGGSGRDRLFGERGDDKMFGGTDKDLYRGGPGDDSEADGKLKTPPNKFTGKDWSVSMRPTWDVPAGTTVTYTPLGSNCVLEEVRGTYPADARDQHMITVDVGEWPWDRCATEKSNAWFQLDFHTPGGLTRTAKILIFQTGIPNVYTHNITIACGGGLDIGCTGGSVSMPTEQVLVTAGFGPLREAQPPPPPTPKPPGLDCGGTIHVSVGDTLKDQHVCTSEGYPVPALTIRDLPDGLTASRWPSAQDSWIVINGRVTAKPGRYVAIVEARTDDGWYGQSYFTLEVSN